MISLVDIEAMREIEGTAETADEPKFDLNQPETLLVELDDGVVTHVTVISDTQGWCSCELTHGGPLDYHIGETCVFPEKNGYFVIENCTGSYTRGDGWTTDDDADFYPGAIRPATDAEIALT